MHLVSSPITLDSLLGISWSLETDGLVALVKITDCNDKNLWFDDIDEDDTSDPLTRYRSWSLAYLVEPCYYRLSIGDSVIALCDDSTVYYPATYKSQTLHHIIVVFDPDESGFSATRKLNKWCIRSKQTVPTVIKKVCIDGTLQQKQFMKAIAISKTKQKKRKRNRSEPCDVVLPPKKKFKIALKRTKGKHHNTTNTKSENTLGPQPPKKRFKIAIKRTKKKQSLFRQRTPLKPQVLNKTVPVGTSLTSPMNPNKERDALAKNDTSDRENKSDNDSVLEKIQKMFEQNRKLVKENAVLEHQNKVLLDQNKRFKTVMQQFIDIGSN
eukprot:183930_1